MSNGFVLFEPVWFPAFLCIYPFQTGMLFRWKKQFRSNPVIPAWYRYSFGPFQSQTCLYVSQSVLSSSNSRSPRFSCLAIRVCPMKFHFLPENQSRLNSFSPVESESHFGALQVFSCFNRACSSFTSEPNGYFPDQLLRLLLVSHGAFEAKWLFYLSQTGQL